MITARALQAEAGEIEQRRQEKAEDDRDCDQNEPPGRVGCAEQIDGSGYRALGELHFPSEGEDDDLRYHDSKAPCRQDRIKGP